MTITRRILCAMASVLVGTAAFAQMNSGQWQATDNENLYNQMLTYLNKASVDLYGEPAADLIRDNMLQITSAHAGAPYAWMSQTHNLCLALEAVYPPCISHPISGATDRYNRIRKAIAILWDYPMHVCNTKNEDDKIIPPADQAQAFSESNLNQVRLRREELMEALSLPAPPEGQMQVIKVYSSGFIFRTAHHAVGIDICYNFGFGNSVHMAEVIEKLDAIFTTHNHEDHFDFYFSRDMIKAGKTAVLPKNLVSGVTSPGRNIVWTESQLVPEEVADGIMASAIMSAQGTEPCLMYYISMDGFNIIHVGDNSIMDSNVFYSDKQKADIIMIPNFNKLTTVFSYTNLAPNDANVTQVYLSTHENEYHHTVFRRIGYQYLFFNRSALADTSNQKYPCYSSINNGEMFTLTK